MHWRAAGTQLGQFGPVPPTGTVVSYSGATFLRFDADGQDRRRVERQRAVPASSAARRGDAAACLTASHARDLPHGNFDIDEPIGRRVKVPHQYAFGRFRYPRRKAPRRRRGRISLRRGATARLADRPLQTSAIRPARAALERVFAFFPGVIRLTCGLTVAVVAFAVPAPNVDPALLAAAMVVLTAWSLVFFQSSRRHGISAPLVLLDLALTAAVCLLMPQLVAPQVLVGGVSWVAVLSSTSVIVCQFALPAVAGVPAGLLVTVAYVVGARAAGNPVEADSHGIVLAVQTVLAAGLVYLTRRSSRDADRPA